MKALQPKDFRQGITVYEVMAFPYRGKRDATVEEIQIWGRPYRKPGLTYLSLWVDVRVENYLFGGYRIDSRSLKDAGVMENNYNMHRWFKTRKQAQRYADRMNDLRLSASEAKKARKLADDWADNERWERALGPDLMVFDVEEYPAKFDYIFNSFEPVVFRASNAIHVGDVG